MSPYRIPDPPAPETPEKIMLKDRFVRSLQDRKTRTFVGAAFMLFVFFVLEGIGRLVFVFDPLTHRGGEPAGEALVTIMAPLVGAMIAALTIVAFHVVRLLPIIPAFVGDEIARRVKSKEKK